MAPIIYSFLRMSAEPTWYNQDGAVRTAVATVMSVVLGDGEFHKWSLNVFASMLMLDWLRILIWFDHMGLRVATLVNLSFIGGDMLDEKAARAMGHSAPSRVIPEGLRRFGTWMPLLIPFYIPRGGDWDYAWGMAENAAKAGTHTGPTAAAFVSILFAAGIVIASVRSHKRRPASHHQPSNQEAWTRRALRLNNEQYTLEIAADGRGWSRVYRTPASRDEIDVTRKPDSPYSTSGKILYVVEDRGEKPEIWSLLRSPIPATDAIYTAVVHPKSIHFLCERGDIRSEIDASVHHEEPIEYWRIRLINQGSTRRSFRLVSYRDLVLNGTGVSQRHPSFNDLHLCTRFIPQLQGIFASNRLLLGKGGRPGEETFFHAYGPLPTNAKLVGYRDSRTHVVGQGSERMPLGLWDAPRPVDDIGQLYTFDPAASLELAITLEPGHTVELELADGWAQNLQAASERISRCLGTPRMRLEELRHAASTQRQIEISGKKESEMPKPWCFSDDGKRIHVTEDTPRPWSHPVSNPLGYGFLATNEGALFSFATNAQQNPVTPFTLGLNSGLTPGQAWHLWNTETDEPVLQLPRRLGVKGSNHPLECQTEFGRGYVRYALQNMQVQFELTAFVVPDQPAEGRIVKIKNTTDASLQLRLASCFQIALAEVPNDSRNNLMATWNPGQHIFLFENPGQQFRRGPAFVSPGFPIESAETVYRHFLGRGRTPEQPLMAQFGRADGELSDDGYRVAAFSTAFELAPGEEKIFCVSLGQCDSIPEALSLAEQLKTPNAQALELLRAQEWWEEFLGVLRVETEDPAFDRLVNDWLPYQVVASRLWGRTGAYQRSGAFGFRDQLQDVIPLASIHPEICRKQILLHAAQQFREGDTMQWWHTTWEGKTGIGARNRASDVMLWLPHVVSLYLQNTGDHQILDEQVGFLEGQQIPAAHEGIVFAPRDTQDKDSLYEHCRRSIDWALNALGAHGVPKMGAGDWNDGLDMVGRHGTGESTWLGFFLHCVLKDFADIATTRSDEDSAKRYSAAAESLAKALDSMWRGNKYLRALMDDGADLLFDDALTSSWPILSRAVDIHRGGAALEHGITSLERDNIMVLLAPPFNEHSQPYPGRIGVYPPGVRENGGQYSHGCSWLVDAVMELSEQLERNGQTDKAKEWRARGAAVWKKISPLAQTTPEQWHRYGLEPHQQPADIYFGPGYEGRGGWSWYSGSGGRMLTAAWKLLGIVCENQEVRLHSWASERESWPKLRRVEYRGEEIYKRK
jgi:cyclic beta-1,2-glucan synthetase